MHWKSSPNQVVTKQNSSTINIYVIDTKNLQLDSHTRAHTYSTQLSISNYTLHVLLSVTARINQLYALSDMLQRLKKQSPTQDRLIYSPLEDVFTMWQCSPEKFRISYANTDFKLCASYPEAAIVPKAISDEDLKKVKQ